MGRDWVLFESVSVLSNHRINFIEDLSKLSFEHPIDGLCVKWYIDQDEGVALIGEPLESDSDVVEVKRSAVMGDSDQIRPPKSVRDEVRGEIEPNKTVYYLASEGMIKESPCLCLTLTPQKVFDILDNNFQYVNY